MSYKDILLYGKSFNKTKYIDVEYLGTSFDYSNFCFDPNCKCNSEDNYKSEEIRITYIENGIKYSYETEITDKIMFISHVCFINDPEYLALILKIFDLDDYYKNYLLFLSLIENYNENFIYLCKRFFSKNIKNILSIKFEGGGCEDNCENEDECNYRRLGIKKNTTLSYCFFKNVDLKILQFLLKNGVELNLKNIFSIVQHNNLELLKLVFFYKKFNNSEIEELLFYSYKKNLNNVFSYLYNKCNKNNLTYVENKKYIDFLKKI